MILKTEQKQNMKERHACDYPKYDGLGNYWETSCGYVRAGKKVDIVGRNKILDTFHLSNSIKSKNC
jgi:hypothetical protein